MATLTGAGITLDLPPGWEGVIEEEAVRPDGAVRHALVHLANFPLPANRGNYGGGVVEGMRPGDVLVVLFEFDAASAQQPLFRDGALPRSLTASDFGRDTLHRRIEGHGGVQRFFVAAGRAFCLYVVVASHIDRADLLPAVNAVLGSLQIR